MAMSGEQRLPSRRSPLPSYRRWRCRVNRGILAVAHYFSFVISLVEITVASLSSFVTPLLSPIAIQGEERHPSRRSPLSSFRRWRCRVNSGFLALARHFNLFVDGDVG